MLPRLLVLLVPLVLLVLVPLVLLVLLLRQLVRMLLRPVLVLWLLLPKLLPKLGSARSQLPHVPLQQCSQQLHQPPVVSKHAIAAKPVWHILQACSHVSMQLASPVAAMLPILAVFRASQGLEMASNVSGHCANGQLHRG